VSQLGLTQEIAHVGENESGRGRALQQ